MLRPLPDNVVPATECERLIQQERDERLDLTATMHNRLSDLEARIAELQVTRVECQTLREQVDQVTEVLTTMGAFCQALASATERLTAES